MGHKPNRRDKEVPPRYDEPVDPRTHYVTPVAENFITTFPGGQRDPNAPKFQRPKREAPAPTKYHGDTGPSERKFTRFDRTDRKDHPQGKGPRKEFHKDGPPRRHDARPPREAAPPRQDRPASPPTGPKVDSRHAAPSNMPKEWRGKRRRFDRPRTGKRPPRPETEVQATPPGELNESALEPQNAQMIQSPPEVTGPVVLLPPAQQWSTPEANLTIRRGAEEKLLQGHPWIWANEVQDLNLLKAKVSPGAVVDCYGGMPSRYVGRGVFNPNSLISVRLFSREQVPLDSDFLRKRLSEAIQMRERIYPGEKVYRLVYGEADGLPGLVVDRYEDGLIMQSYTLISDLRMNEMAKMLQELTGAAWIIEKSVSTTREKEGLSPRENNLYGTPPEEMEIKQDKVKFVIRPGSQKGGFYLDQRVNRRKVAAYAEDRRVLDLFCHVGGFGITAAVAGAREVVCVDSSGAALELLEKSAKKNRVSAKITALDLDAFKYLDALPETEMFDLVIVDPPALAKNKSSIREAMRAYAQLNERAIAHLSPDGILATFSCSSHVTGELFYEMLVTVCGRVGRRINLIEPLGQAPDHPILVGLRETQYLKGWLAVVK